MLFVFQQLHKQYFSKKILASGVPIAWTVAVKVLTELFFHVMSLKPLLFYYYIRHFQFDDNFADDRCSSVGFDISQLYPHFLQSWLQIFLVRISAICSDLSISATFNSWAFNQIFLFVRNLPLLLIMISSRLSLLVRFIFK